MSARDFPVFFVECLHVCVVPVSPVHISPKKTFSDYRFQLVFDFCVESVFEFSHIIHNTP